MKQTALRYAPEAAWLELSHAPKSLISASGRRQAVETLQGRRVAAFCGIGNPAGFQRTLERCGAVVAGFREFPDHHAYDRTDIESLAAWCDELDAEMAVCTAKDLVKLGIERLGRLPLWAVAIELEFVSGQQEFEARLQLLLGAAGE